MTEARTLLLTRAVGLISSVLLVGIALLTLGDVGLRTFFSAPSARVFEMTELGMGMVAFLSVAYAAGRDRHVSIDLIPSSRAKLRSVLDTVTSQISGALVFLFAVAAAVLFGNDLMTGIQIGHSAGLPRWPGTLVLFASTVILGACLFARNRGAGKSDNSEPDASLEKGVAL